MRWKVVIYGICHARKWLVSGNGQKPSAKIERNTVKICVSATSLQNVGIQKMYCKEGLMWICMQMWWILFLWLPGLKAHAGTLFLSGGCSVIGVSGRKISLSCFMGPCWTSATLLWWWGAQYLQESRFCQVFGWRTPCCSSVFLTHAWLKPI